MAHFESEQLIWCVCGERGERAESTASDKTMVEQQNTEDNRPTAAETITDINDPRIQVFANLKDSKAHARDGIFIAEGPEV